MSKTPTSFNRLLVSTSLTAAAALNYPNAQAGVDLKLSPEAPTACIQIDVSQTDLATSILEQGTARRLDLMAS